ncbi:MAG TPA: F0F1 ATP synthase subunit B [Gaiellaceae bacterium]|nr:F0F1 ATP synthase subunit B [Gaiellaceae bacterium]
MNSVLATNPLIQVTPGLMIWTVVCFLITFFVLKRYAFGAIQKIIDERRQRIRDALDEADKARAEARQMLEEHRALMAEARGKAEEILTHARQVAESQKKRMRDELEADRKRRLEETTKQVEAETQRALEAIRAEVAELTVLATQKVTGKVLDQADHKRLIEEAVRELDFSVLEGSSRN